MKLMNVLFSFPETKKNGEKFDTYVGVLRVLVKSCNFGDKADSLLRDKIVIGINSSHTRKKLLVSEKLELQKCIDVCRAEESTEMRAGVIKKGSDDAVHDSTMHAFNKHKKKVSQKPTVNARKPPPQSGQTTVPDVDCIFCGKRHPRAKRQCPAWGATCNKCKGKNHFSVKCRAGKARVNAVSGDYDEYEDYEEIYHLTCTTHSVGGDREICVEMMLEGKLVVFEIDTGSARNLIGRKHAQHAMLTSSNFKLIMWNKQTLAPLGDSKLRMINPANNRKYLVHFTVVDEDYTPLLGRSASTKMGLVTINEANFKRVNNVSANSVHLIAKYADVFRNELGKLPGKAHFEVDPSVTPVISLRRDVVVSVQPKLKQAIDDLVEKGVLAPVKQPTDWLSYITTTPKKNGDIRICLDPKPLNKALKRQRFQMPKLSELIPELSKAKVFSTFDFLNGYWHVELDEESSLLTTFSTPFGRFRRCCMPFGTKPSAEIIQEKVYSAIGDLKGILNIADDVMLYGSGDTIESSIHDHDVKLEAFLQRCREVGIRLNKKKMKLLCTEAPFMGHLLTAKGIRTDPEKVKAIAEMPAPIDTEGVHHLCGTVNFLCDFVPSMAKIMEPINQLKGKDVPFNWSKAQQTAFDEVKRILTSEPVLQYYDVDTELTVQCDASQNGLGAGPLTRRQSCSIC